MIAPSSPSPADQLALVGDRVECLHELPKLVVTSNGLEIKDCLRFFCGDKPAQQFERGTQIGGTYKCGGCGCKDSMMQDLAHAIHYSWRSLSDLQSLILAGTMGNKAGCLKPFEKLNVHDLRKKLTARGINTDGMLKPQLASHLTEILQGAQRVPTLLTLHPAQSLASLNLDKYEILDCEPLHDIKGHLNNLLPELPYILQPDLRSECQQVLDTTLPKEKVSGAFLRIAATKLLIKLQQHTVDPLLVTLLDTIVRISDLLYSHDCSCTPRAILQLYNCCWLHHELCSHYLSNPRLQTRQHLFGVYLHDLVVHAPPIFQLVCLRSTNTESQERLFSQAKHIGLKATNRKPENALATILLCMQARQKISECQQSIIKQDSMVSSAASALSPYKGTYISKTFISSRLPSWQAHLTCISSYLKHGQGIWWQEEREGYRFLDSDSDHQFHAEGPKLQHFCTCTLPDIYQQCSKDWDTILQKKITLPSPGIRLYDTDGNYLTTTSHLTSFCNVDAGQPSPSMEPSTNVLASSPHSANPLSTPPRDEQPLPSPCLRNQPSPTLQRDNNPSSSPHRGNQLSSTCDRVNLPPSSTHTGNKPLPLPHRGNQCSSSSSDTCTPLTASQPLTTPVSSSNTSSKTKQLLFTPNTATQTAPSSESETHNTLLPRNICDNTSLLSLRVSGTIENASVQCTIDDFIDEELPTSELQTKAAKVICKVIGNSSDLNRFVTLRANLKEQKKWKPTTSEREEYKTLLANYIQQSFPQSIQQKMPSDQWRQSTLQQMAHL